MRFGNDELEDTCFTEPSIERNQPMPEPETSENFIKIPKEKYTSLLSDAHDLKLRIERLCSELERYERGR